MKSGFFILGLIISLVPSLALANVVINEIAWMGTSVSTADEWMELKNTGTADVNLSGWILEWKNGDYKINFSEKCSNTAISAGGYLLLERTDDTTVPTITADCIYTGALSNDGEKLILKDAVNNPIDTVDASGGWPKGDNTTKQTMQWSGSIWITATATPKAVNAGVSAPSESPPQQQQSQSQPSGGGNSPPYIPPELLPKIKAYAGEDKTVTVGASVEFRGQGFGLKDEPLDNARYLWTFGDGASKEGKNITHVYQYPGEYIVSLNVSSGEYSASDYMLVKAIPNQVFISEIKTDTNSWIELENKSKEEIDISGCQMKYNNPPSDEAGQRFIFPQSTRIRSNAFLVIPFSVSGINLLQGKGLVEFLYSGGFKADSFNYNGFLQAGQSFNRAGENSVIGAETPAAKNSIIVAKSAEVAPPQNRGAGGATSAIIPAAETAEIKEDNTQTANIITVGDSSGAKSNTTIYLIAIGGLILFAVAGIIFIRRKGLTKI